MKKTHVPEMTDIHELASPPRTDLKISENVPLAPRTTFKIGGPARYFARAETEQQIVEAFGYAEQRGLPVFVLGGGSNILVSDAGYDGLVIHVALRGLTGGNASVNERGPRVAVKSEPHPDDHTATLPNGRVYARSDVTAAAGEDWDKFVAFCVENDLAGVECLSGIPGSVGGTPVQNVGAYGQEVSDAIVSVRCFDRRAKKIVELSNPECGFEYRKSIFNTTEKERYVVLSATYSLVNGGRPRIEYKDLKEHFSVKEPTLAETRQAVLDIRQRKSMVIDPSDANSRSAGSFFKNPVVEGARVGEIADVAGAADIPRYPAGDGLVKVPAAWLIERAGFCKGFRLGNAGISDNHSLALVNRGGATASEILALKDLIQAQVAEKFGIELQPEPIFIGKM